MFPQCRGIAWYEAILCARMLFIIDFFEFITSPYTFSEVICKRKDTVEYYNYNVMVITDKTKEKHLNVIATIASSIPNKKYKNILFFSM